MTRPGPAVQKVLDDLRGTPPSAIILLSDGITTTTDNEKLTTVAEAARNRLVPIYTVALGSEEPARDLQIYGLLAEDFAFVNDPVAFSAKLKAYGFENQDITVRLKQKGSSKVLAEQTVKAGADGEAIKVELTHAPPKKGEFEYVLEVPLKPDETNTQNNVTQPQLVSVSQDPDPRAAWRIPCPATSFATSKISWSAKPSAKATARWNWMSSCKMPTWNTPRKMRPPSSISPCNGKRFKSTM